MVSLLKPPAHIQAETGPHADARYRRLRWQVFIGAFIGYAGFYLVRKNLSMAIPSMEPLGFDKAELGFVLGLNAAAYALSKFLMGSVSDRSNARAFLPLGLILSAVAMCFMIVPIRLIGAERKTLAIVVMGVLNSLVGWFNGMGWPPCGRVMAHWFSASERGTMMSIWNCAHNVGGAVVVASLIGIGFFIYGPVMLIGVQALDLAPKNAAGTAAGLTGFFGYFLGTFILANWVVGWVAQTAGWSWTFLLLVAACLLSIFFMALTCGQERGSEADHEV